MGIPENMYGYEFFALHKRKGHVQNLKYGELRYLKSVRRN